MIALRKSILPLACLTLLGLGTLAHAQDYKAANYFNSTTNTDVTNPYKYGTENTLGGAFTLYTTYQSSAFPPFTAPIESWNSGNNDVPAVLYNPTSSDYSVDSGGNPITIGAHQLALHPSSTGQYSVVRFVAPTAGTYNVSAAFFADDTKPTSTDVHVLVGGASVFDGEVAPNQTYAPHAFTLALGETVDFAVGYGTNQNYYNDTTGLTANVAAVPELSTLLGFGSFVAIGGLTAFRQRKSVRKAV